MKQLDINKTVYNLVKENPEIKDVLFEIGFKDIIKPGMIQLAGRVMTVKKGIKYMKMDINEVKEKLKKLNYEMIGEDIDE